MIKGTTPTFTFELPFDASTIEAAYLTFQQGTAIAFEKDMTSATKEGQFISFQVAQKDTLGLADSPDVTIQFRCKTADGRVYASGLIEVPVVPTLKDVEI